MNLSICFYSVTIDPNYVCLSYFQYHQSIGLMSNIAPENSKKDPTKRKDHKKFNTYFDETTITYRRKPVVEQC